MENNIENILNIIKHPTVKKEAKLVVFLSLTIDEQMGVLEQLDITKKLEKFFFKYFLSVKSNKSNFEKLLDENYDIKNEIKEYLTEKVEYRITPSKLNFEFNPIYFKRILEFRETHKKLHIPDDDFMFYLKKIHILDKNESIVLAELMSLIDNLIELKKDIDIRLENIGQFQNKDDEKAQIDKASLVLISYAKKTGNHKMVKYLKEIPHFWITKRDIINYYKEYSYTCFKLFCLKVSNNDDDKLADNFSKSLSYYLS